MARTKGSVSVVSISVRLRARTGQQAEVPVEPRTDDAVFFTLGAVDKFLIPLYAARDGLDAALKLRARIARTFRQTGGVGVALHQGMCETITPPLQWTATRIGR